VDLVMRVPCPGVFRGFAAAVAILATNPVAAPDADSARIDAPSSIIAPGVLPTSPTRGIDSNASAADSNSSAATTASPVAADSARSGVDSTTTGSATSGRAAGATVTIRAQGRHKRKEISSTVLKREEMKKVVATAQDPLRALPTLPGVSVASDLSVRPIVRGGDQAETGVELDGVPLLMPYHFGSVFSVFHREAVEDFQLYSGVAPARAEGALSGTVLARSRSAPLDTLFGGADLSLLRGSAWVGVPVVRDRLGVWISGQSFWYDWVIKRAMDGAALSGAADKDDVETYKATTSLPTNWDAQGALAARLTPDLLLDVGGFVAGDRYQIRDRVNTCVENGREVPCPARGYYGIAQPDGLETPPDDEYCAYANDRGSFVMARCADHPEKRTVYDTSANVELRNWMARSRLTWSPSPELAVEAVAAFQKVAWDVRFPGRRDFDLVDSAANRWRVVHVGDSERFDWRRTSMDLGLSLRNRWSDEHETSLGVGLERGHRIVRTDLDRSLAQLIQGTTGNPLEFMGYFNEREVLVLDSRDAPYLTMDRIESLDFTYDTAIVHHRENLWIEHRWDLDGNTRLRLGMRVNQADGRLEPPNPRLQVQTQVTGKDLVGIGVALHTQSELPFEWRLAAPSGLSSEKAWLGIVEWEHAFAPGWRTTFSGWGKLYRDLASPRLERDPLADSARWRQEVTSWFWGHLDELGIDPQSFFERFNYRYDPSLPWEENERRSDSTRKAMYAAQQDLVPAQVRHDIGAWLQPRRLVYESTGEGWAAGLEASLRYQPTAIWTGWTSAEWSMSRRRDRPDGIWYPFGLERPWKFSWVNSLRIDRTWEASVRYTAMGGNPYTPFKFWDDDYGSTRNTGSASDTALWIGSRNSGTLAAYQRLDLRLSRESTIFGKPATYYYEVWNALNDPNMILRDAESGQFRWISMNMPFPVVFLGCEVRF